MFPQFEYGNEADANKWQWEKLEEWAAKDGGKLSADGRVLLGFALVSSLEIHPFGLILTFRQHRYDLDSFSADPTLIPMHQEALRRARALPAAIITGHVVSGQ